MSDLEKDAVASDETQAETVVEAADGEEKPKKKGKGLKIFAIVAAVVVVVVAGAGIGVWVWHEQPSFCAAICHTPMDPYLATYEETSGQAGTDKYGNAVADASGMMVVTHKDAGEDCLACHVPTMSEQITEATNWISGNYMNPLEERSLEELTAAKGATTDEQFEEFCMNGTCHADISRADGTFKEATADLGTRNPHEQPHGDLLCSDCHKAHRASVNACTQCHTDAPLPEGWINDKDAKAIKKAAMGK